MGYLLLLNFKKINTTPTFATYYYFISWPTIYTDFLITIYPLFSTTFPSLLHITLLKSWACRVKYGMISPARTRLCSNATTLVPLYNNSIYWIRIKRFPALYSAGYKLWAHRNSGNNITWLSKCFSYMVYSIRSRVLVTLFPIKVYNYYK